MINKSLILSLFGLLTLLTIVGVGSAVTYVSSCQTLNTAGETYILTQNVSVSSGSCFSFNNLANDITLDLNGFEAQAKYSGTGTPASISISGRNVTVKNGLVKGGLRGITVVSSPTSSFTIIRDVIISDTNQSGILNFDNNISISNVTIRNFSTSVSTGAGIVFALLLSGGEVENVVIDGGSKGIYLTDSISNISFEDISIRNIDNVNILLEGYTPDNTFKDVSTDLTKAGVVITDDFGVSNSNIFINVSYLNETFRDASASSLIRQWYFDAQANFTNGQPAYNAQFNITNVTGALISSGTTDVNGNIPRQILTDYVNTGGTKVYAWNYTINAKRPISNLYTALFDMNNTNRFHQITLEKKIQPSFDILI